MSYFFFVLVRLNDDGMVQTTDFLLCTRSPLFFAGHASQQYRRGIWVCFYKLGMASVAQNVMRDNCPTGSFARRGGL